MTSTTTVETNSTSPWKPSRGGQVEIRRYTENADGRSSLTVVARLKDKLCRFLTAGDVDGDGNREIVAATNKSGLWLLRPDSEKWDVSLIDKDSSRVRARLDSAGS